MKFRGSLFCVGLLSAILAGGIAFPAGAAVHRGAKTPDVVYFRSVLCFAPSFNATAPNPGPLTSSLCSAASRLNQHNLQVEPLTNSAAGFSSQNVAPDEALAAEPSTSATKESATAAVLLPGYRDLDWPAARYLLGPAEMTSASVAEASATLSQTGAWVVDYTMTKHGSALWDKVARENFHKVLGIDFDGKVVSAPVIQPTQSSFTSFNGQGEISGNFTKPEAMAVANALNHD